jgi:hypothetical protein
MAESKASSPHGLTFEAESVIRCALADLIGAYQDHKLKGCPDSPHDWDAHLTIISELAAEFDMQSEIPEDLQNASV